MSRFPFRSQSNTPATAQSCLPAARAPFQAVCTIIAIGLSAILAGMGSAHAAPTAKNKHIVYSVEQAEVRNPDPLKSWDKAPEETAPGKTHAAAASVTRDIVNISSEPSPFSQFYTFPEPQQTAAVEETKSHAALYWIGATGAALAAGVAAWFIFSDEPKSQKTYAIVP